MGLFSGIRNRQQFNFTGAPVGLVSLPSLGGSTSGSSSSRSRGSSKSSNSSSSSQDEIQGITTQQQMLLVNRSNIDQKKAAMEADIMNRSMNSNEPVENLLKEIQDVETQLAREKFQSDINENIFNKNTDISNQFSKKIIADGSADEYQIDDYGNRSVQDVERDEGGNPILDANGQPTPTKYTRNKD